MPQHDFISDVQRRKVHQITFTLMPDNWKSYSPQVKLNWEIAKFDEQQAASIPNNSGGVYTFVVIPKVADHPYCSYLMYVGRVQQGNNFRKRYREYLKEKNDPKGRPLVQLMLQLWEEHLWFCYARIDETANISDVENSLIKALDPVINVEYPAEVQATRRAASL